MKLSEKLKETPFKDRENLVGTKVKISEGNYAKNLTGNFRHLQSNGEANIYLNESYVDPKGKSTKWIKIAPHNVDIVE